MTPAVAIVGMACRYADAQSPTELWENVLAQRRAFRRIPAERLRAEDYLSADPAAPDKTYTVQAAVIEGYEFDRVRFKIVGSTFRSADLAHWLALDVAAQALADAGFAEGRGLPRETTGVVVGNTLTGEFSRANLMRYRWPYVRRVVEAALTEAGGLQGMRDAGRGVRQIGRTKPTSPTLAPRHSSLDSFLTALEARYKEPFPPVGEESLAGGLSNTIAGRICNHFDLKGGGFTIDGACASSLLAVADACGALVAGDLDVALAGGVDLSLDPFELVGFAKAGALAADEMRVYDARSQGFWPGEGCGFVVLMRYDEAVAQGRRVYATIRGWGVSSDGSGGITRPEAEGQLLALRRAYRRAGFGIQTVGFFEGHGTGTAVGDETELRALARALDERREERTHPAALGSIKANIGHTKAAAGVAGLIKATLALHTQVLPPTTGCQTPHPLLQRPQPRLRLLPAPELWPADRPLRAAVSAMGFGGINTHLVLEGISTERRRAWTARERRLAAAAQDAELFCFRAADAAELHRQVAHVASFAARLSLAELTDLAAGLARRTAEAGGMPDESAPSDGPAEPRAACRAALVASRPAELAERLQTLLAWLEAGVGERIDFPQGIFLSHRLARPRVGFLFPGQGSPTPLDGGVYRRRFPEVADLFDPAQRPSGPEQQDISTRTEVAQPAIVAASLAGLRVLRRLGLEADVAVGHSLGELTALFWADSLDEAALLRIAAARGRAMGEVRGAAGAMASIGAGESQVRALFNGEAVVVAGLNSPRQTVISGAVRDVETVVQRALASGLPATRLPVAHAFHSALVAAAAPVLAAQLANEELHPPRRRVASSVTGRLLDPKADLRELLCRQVTQPVRFIDAVAAAASFEFARQETHDQSAPPGKTHPPRASLGSLSASAVGLWIEVGPGHVLQGLVRDLLQGEAALTRRPAAGGAPALMPVVSLDAGGPSLRGLLQAVGAAFALGAPVRINALFDDRFTRPFNLAWQPKFFVNPCELAPQPTCEERPASEAAGASQAEERQPESAGRRPAVSQRGETIEEWAAEHLPSDAAPGARAAPLPRPSADEPRTPGADSPLDLVRRLVAERAELPPSAIHDDHRLLSDLHLNSITVGQLVAEAARRLGLPPQVGVTEFANASVRQIGDALAELRRTGAGCAQPQGEQWPAGVDSWVREFAVEWVETPASSARAAKREAGAEGRLATQPVARPAPDKPPAVPEGWRVFAPANHPLAQPLQEAFEAAGGSGVVVCLPALAHESRLEPNDATIAAEREAVDLLLAGARAALEDAARKSNRETGGAPRPAVGNGVRSGGRFVLVQHGWSAAAFARTLHLEAPAIDVCVVNVPSTAAPAVQWVKSEALAAAGFVEVRYDADGRRLEPRWKARPWAEALTGDGDGNMARRSTVPLLTGKDVLLVTGGGKGIAAECALALARETGVRLALLGRASPEADAELTANLQRFAKAGVRWRYFPADVTDPAAVARAVSEARRDLGEATALLHGAGTNVPQLVSALDAAAFAQTLRPKVDGLRHLLAAVDPRRLRLLVTFGSIIGRAGLPGEADYAVANEWLAELTGQFAAAHPNCRCLCLEWSVWSGVGMGQRLGRVELLARQGITPISPDAGVRVLRRLLARPPQAARRSARQSKPASRLREPRTAPGSTSPVAVVVTGRFGQPPTVKLARPDLPFLRFLERPRVFYPGVELVVEAELSDTSDPYLNDHRYHGEALFPAVMGLEAMAQAALVLVERLQASDEDPATGGQPSPPGSSSSLRRSPAPVPCFEKVEWSRPVVVARGRRTTIRLAALVRAPGMVEVVLRSEETGFQVDHFRAVCRFAALPADRGEGETAALFATPFAPEAQVAGLDPARDLYDELLFHEGRFRRLCGYRKLRARECIAEIAPSLEALVATAEEQVGPAPASRPTPRLAPPWFAHYLPPRLVLGDAAARDAAIHAIQACIPHRRVLPVGVERIETGELVAEERATHDDGQRADAAALARRTATACQPANSRAAGWLVHAREVAQAGDVFTYDLAITTRAGRVVERWRGLRLRAVEEIQRRSPWPPALLGPCLERRLEDFCPGSRAGVVVLNTNASWAERSERAVQSLLGGQVALCHRPDGKPEVAPALAKVVPRAEALAARNATIASSTVIGQVEDNPTSPRRTVPAPRVSLSHHRSLTLAMATAAETACDIEAVSERPPETWQALLGGERYALAELVARDTGEALAQAATRVWCGAECLKKLGAPPDAPLVLAQVAADGWVLFQAGARRLATLAVAADGEAAPLVISVLAPTGE